MSENEERPAAGDGEPSEHNAIENGRYSSSPPPASTARPRVIEVRPGATPLPRPGTILVVGGTVDQYDPTLPGFLGRCDYGVALKKLNRRTWARARRLAIQGHAVVLMQVQPGNERWRWESAIRAVVELHWLRGSSKWWTTTSLPEIDAVPWPPRGDGRAV